MALLVELQRFMQDTDVLRLNPIQGLKDVELTSLREGIKHAMQGDAEFAKHDYDIEALIDHALEEAADLMQQASATCSLELDMIAALHAYTQESALYKTLNARLRDENRKKITPFFPFLKLLLTALYRLPAIHATVFRGIDVDVSGQYREARDKGQKVKFWSVTSATRTADVLETFLGDKGEPTVLPIESSSL